VFTIGVGTEPANRSDTQRGHEGCGNGGRGGNPNGNGGAGGNGVNGKTAASERSLEVSAEPVSKAETVESLEGSAATPVVAVPVETAYRWCRWVHWRLRWQWRGRRRSQRDGR
jgi:hypothetical protein